MIVDTDEGNINTMTKIVWYIDHVTNHHSLMSEYQDKYSSQLLQVVHGITKVHILNRIEPVLVPLNYATLVDYENKQEYLC